MMTTIFDLPPVRKPNRNRNSDRIEIIPDLEPDLGRSSALRIPTLAEPQIARHYTRLSRMNYGVDDGLYPLGSCTMKYNPKLHEQLVGLPEFASVHPGTAPELAQGTLAALYRMSRLLGGIAGLPAVTLQPSAGAHGELTGMFLIKRFFEVRGESDRDTIILTDSAHGTNPASAVLAGFKVRELKSLPDGTVDVNALSDALDEHTAGVMLTVPNTLGLFETRISEITARVHDAGGLCYFDGANLNSFIGRARPGDMGADIFHFNLHKTMSTPHGGGGPGSGPVAVASHLEPYLPVPWIRFDGQRYDLDWSGDQAIGSVHPYLGNVGVILKAFAYLLRLGDEGLAEVSAHACLHANYLQHRLKGTYKLPYDRLCKHEFVLSGEGIAEGVSTTDIAKRLIDFGFHPPTVYFPLIVHEALMIEPTETETKESLDAFVEAMLAIAEEASSHPERLHDAPRSAPVRRLDQTQAAREPVLRYRFKA